MAQGIFYDGSNLILSASVVHMSASTMSMPGIDNLSSSIAEQTQRVFTLGADGSSNYTFTGPGLTGTENDPTIYLTRGETYRFVNNMGAHPFRLQTTPNGSTGTQYNDGVTNNDVSNGTLTIDVQFDAPSIIYYQCTTHSGMGGVIKIIDSPISIVNSGAEEYNFTMGLNLLSASSGYTNIAVGYNILNNNVGDSNVGIGEYALDDNVGDSNVGIGYDTLYSNEGDSNVGIGYDTLYDNVGDSNVGIGGDALYSNVGSLNVGIGDDALYNNVGDSNVGIGEYTLNGNEGNYNVGIGYYAGSTLSVSGSYNTLIGAESYINSSDVISRSTAIGAEAYTERSNTIILGNVDDNSLKVGIGTTTPSKKLEVAGDIAITGFPSISASLASGGGGGGSTDTGSLMVTGSVSSNTLTFTKGDGSTFDLTVAGGGGSTDTGSLLTTASVSSNTITFTKGDSSTFDITVDTGSGGGGGGSQNLQQVLDTGNTATQDIDLTGHIDADEYKLLGYTIITGSGQVNNVSIGDGVGIGGNKLVAIGKDAFQSGGNDFNTVIGFQAGRSVNTVDSLTAIGGQAAEFHTGSQSVLVGQLSGQNSHTDRALIMGVAAGQNVRESDVVLLGYNAGQYLYNGTATLAIGFKAGQYSSGSNTLIGGSAGIRNHGTNNVFIGQAGTDNTGDDNVAFGYAAAEFNTGEDNTAFGFRSLRNNTGNGNVSFNGCGQNNTGNNNLFFGTATNNSGDGNVFLGFESYEIGLNNSGDKNLVFGSHALKNNNGNDNIALGHETLQYKESGSQNLAIGHAAGKGYWYNNLPFTGSYNTFVGYLAGYGRVGSGSFSGMNLTHATAIGSQATVEQNYAIVLGQANNYNTKVGIGTTTPSTRLHIVGNTTTNTQSSLLIEDSGGAELFKVRNDGVVSIDGITNVSQSIADAASSGGGGSTDLQTVLDAGNSATSDMSLNGVLTLNSGSSISNANGNLVIGYQALNNNPGVIDTLAIGYRAIYNLTSNYSYNTAIGQEAMNSVGGGQNVAVGYQAGFTTNGGSNARSVYIGASAGRNTVSTAGEVAVGYAAGMANSNSYSTGVGYEVFRTSNGQYSVAIGYHAGRSSTGQRSTFVGASAGKNNTGQYSVGIGYSSLQNTSGTNNVAIGYHAGYEGGANILTGNSNTFLGYNASYGTNTTITNSTAVGANITLTDSNTVILGNSTSVGVGTTSPTSKLHIDGTAGEQLRIANSFTPSSTSDTTGETGDIAWDDSYFYVKTSAGWKRAALSTWP